MKAVIDYINIQLAGLSLFSRIEGLAHAESRIDGEDTIGFVALYTSGGESEEIRFDNTDSLLFHLQTGNTSRNETESETGCSMNVEQTIGMRVVAYFDRDIYCQDNAYTLQKIAENMMNVISFTNNRTLRRALGMGSVSVMATGANTDTREVWNEIFNGIEYGLPSDKGLISIDYSITLSGSLSCFPVLGCDDEEIDVAQNIIAEICPGVTIFDTDGVTVLDVIPPGGSYTITQEVTDNMEIINYTVPLAFDANYISPKKVKFTALAGKALSAIIVFLDGHKQKYLDGVTASNEIKQILSDGTIEWWQNSVAPKRELIILYKTN